MTYPASRVTRTNAEKTFTLGNIAGFTGNGTRMTCSPPQDLVIGGITHYGAQLPRGVTAEISADRKRVLFRGGVVPGAQLIPAQPGTFCELVCDDSARLDPTCTRNPTTPQTGAFRSGATAFQLRMAGSVESLTVSGSGEMRLTCKWTVPQGNLATVPAARPNDVIGVSGANFLRGYDLEGNRLRSACSGMSTTLCGPPVGGGSTTQFQQCIADATNSCVSVFGGPDPCHPEDNCGFGSCTRGSDCVSNNCVEGCCVPVIR